MKIRKATLRDLDVLVHQRRRMFEDMGHTDPVLLRRADRAYRKWARQRLKSRKLIGFLAESGKRIVAGGCLWLQEEQPRPGFDGGPVPYLLSVFTEPEFRGRGLASKITREAIRWCRARGYRVMLLHASKMGRRVYKRLGYKRTWEMKLELPARP